MDMDGGEGRITYQRNVYLKMVPRANFMCILPPF